MEPYDPMVEAVQRRLWDIYLFASINHSPRQPHLMPRASLDKFARKCNIVQPSAASSAVGVGSLGPLGSPRSGITAPRSAARRRSSAMIVPNIQKPARQAWMLQAEVNALYQELAARHPTRKFHFSSFCSALGRMAVRVFAPERLSEEDALPRLLKENVLPNAPARRRHDVRPVLRDVADLRNVFLPALEHLYRYFAGHPSRHEREALGRHLQQPESAHASTPLIKSMHFDQFLRFSTTFRICAGNSSSKGTELSMRQLATVFFDSIDVEGADVVGGLSLDEFWEALVRCSLLATLPAPAAGSRFGAQARLITLLKFAAAAGGEEIPRVVNSGHELGLRGQRAGDSSSRSTNASGLIKGGKELQRLAKQFRVEATHGGGETGGYEQQMRGYSGGRGGGAAAADEYSDFAPHREPAAPTERDSLGFGSLGGDGSGERDSLHAVGVVSGRTPRRSTGPVADEWEREAGSGAGAGAGAGVDAANDGSGALRMAQQMARLHVLRDDADADTDSGRPGIDVGTGHNAETMAAAKGRGTFTDESTYGSSPAAKTSPSAPGVARRGAERSAQGQPELNAALFKATVRDDLGAIHRLLQLGANPMARNKAGYTVTGLAAERNRTRALDFFLSLGLQAEKATL